MYTHSGEVFYTVNNTVDNFVEWAKLWRGVGSARTQVAMLQPSPATAETPHHRAAQAHVHAMSWTGQFGSADINPAAGADVYTAIGLKVCAGEIWAEVKTMTGTVLGKLEYRPGASNATCEAASVPHSPPVSCDYQGTYFIAPLGCNGTYAAHGLACGATAVRLRNAMQVSGARKRWTLSAQSRTEAAGGIAALKPGACPITKLTTGDAGPVLADAAGVTIVPVTNSVCEVVYIRTSGPGDYMAASDGCKGLYTSTWETADPANKKFRLVKAA